MSVLTVCKNIIGANNKRDWKIPDPPIRIAATKGQAATDHAFEVGITDKDGIVVAAIFTTKDGKPIVRCGAKVAITTVYPVKIMR